MPREQLAIIGNGMATGRLLDDLLRRGGLDRYAVSVFGDEPHGCYNRILLNRVLLGGTVDDITLKPAGWYADKGVTLHRGATVSRVSVGARRMWTADGREHYFDRLIFATGSEPRVPRVDGAKLANGEWKDGVAVYRTAADVERMRAAARKGRPAAVIGGGLLGLEAAKGLTDLGMRVTLLHLFDHLLNRQVDRLGGAMLRRHVEDLGIRVRTSVTTKGVTGKSRVEGVVLGGEEVVPAEVVVFASGVQPRIDLAKDSDLPTNAGIEVNDQMETGVPGVYAVGECAEHASQIYGTVQPVYEQCSVLAAVLCGDSSARYRGTKVHTRLKAAGVEVASLGDIDPHGPTDEVVQVIEEQRGVYRKLVIRDGRLAGAVLVGDASAAPGLVQRFERGDPLPANRLDLFASPDLSPAPAGPVCSCHQVGEEQITAAMTAGCRTLQDIAAKTGAGTGCGSCRGKLASLLLKAAPPKAADSSRQSLEVV